MKMHMRHAARWLLILMLCGVVAAAPVLAQDDEATEEPAAAEEVEGEEAPADAESSEEEGEHAEDEEHGDESAGEDVEESEEEESPEGVEILFLLLGIGAVLLVGMFAIGQESAKNTANKEE